MTPGNAAPGKSTERLVIIGIVLFIMILALGLEIIGPQVCRDGWPSLSIGRQGACSHHGGVRTWPQSLWFFASIGLALLSERLVSPLLEKWRARLLLAGSRPKPRERVSRGFLNCLGLTFLWAAIRTLTEYGLGGVLPCLVFLAFSLLAFIGAYKHVEIYWP